MKRLIMLLTAVFFLMSGVSFAQTVNPKDLKKSEPKPPSMRVNPPPALPTPPKPEPTIKEKIEKGIEKEKKEIQRKLDPPRRGPGAGAIRG